MMNKYKHIDIGYIREILNKTNQIAEIELFNMFEEMMKDLYKFEEEIEVIKRCRVEQDNTIDRLKYRLAELKESYVDFIERW